MEENVVLSALLQIAGKEVFDYLEENQTRFLFDTWYNKKTCFVYVARIETEVEDAMDRETVSIYFRQLYENLFGAIAECGGKVMEVGRKGFSAIFENGIAEIRALAFAGANAATKTYEEMGVNAVRQYTACLTFGSFFVTKIGSPKRFVVGLDGNLIDGCEALLANVAIEGQNPQILIHQNAIDKLNIDVSPTKPIGDSWFSI